MDFSKCCDDFKWDPKLLTLVILLTLGNNALLQDIFDGETSNLRNIVWCCAYLSITQPYFCYFQLNAVVLPAG